MAVKLNLLPPELAVDKNLGAALKLVRSFGVILLVAFVLFVVGVSGLFIYDSFVVKSLTADVASVTSQITLQNSSEQQIVLLKDRINKISTVESIPTSLPNLTAVDPFISNLSASSTVNELDIDSQKIDMLVNIKTNDDLSTFLKSLTSTNAFKTVTLTSFGLNPASGYAIGLNIQTK